MAANSPAERRERQALLIPTAAPMGRVMAGMRAGPWRGTSRRPTCWSRNRRRWTTGAWAKSGVMIRETTDPGSAYVFVFITPGNGVNMQYRASTGANGVQLAGVNGLVAPYWVQVMRSGNTFTGFTSADGVTWTQIG